MARRFGRTQKRKMRETVRLETLQLVDYKLKDMDTERERITRQHYELVSGIRKWWDNSVLLDPKTEACINDLPLSYRMTERKMFSITDFSAPIPMSNMEIHYQTLEALDIAMHEDLGERHMHIRLRCGNDHLGYYIDPRAFEVHRGFPETTVKHITHALVRAFKEKYDTRGVKKN